MGYLCNPGCSEIYPAYQADQELRDLPGSASKVLEVKT